jgi:hypothetical protein
VNISKTRPAPIRRTLAASCGMMSVNNKMVEISKTSLKVLRSELFKLNPVFFMNKQERKKKRLNQAQ